MQSLILSPRYSAKAGRSGPIVSGRRFPKIVGLDFHGHPDLSVRCFCFLCAPTDEDGYERQVSRVTLVGGASAKVASSSARWTDRSYSLRCRLDSVLRSLTRLAVQSCLPTASIAFATAVAQDVRPHHGEFIAFQLVLPALYVFSVLYTCERFLHQYPPLPSKADSSFPLQ